MSQVYQSGRCDRLRRRDTGSYSPSRTSELLKRKALLFYATSRLCTYCLSKTDSLQVRSWTGESSEKRSAIAESSRSMWGRWEVSISPLSSTSASRLPLPYSHFMLPVLRLRLVLQHFTRPTLAARPQTLPAPLRTMSTSPSDNEPPRFPISPVPKTQGVVRTAGMLIIGDEILNGKSFPTRKFTMTT